MNIDHLTLLVSSLERCMPYYERLLPLLGFVKKRDHVWSNSSGFFLQFHEAAADSRPYERYGAGMNHIGFSAETPQQVHAIRESMQAAGFEVPEIQHLRGAVALFMKDLDGIRFEITSYPPVLIQWIRQCCLTKIRADLRDVFRYEPVFVEDASNSAFF